LKVGTIDVVSETPLSALLFEEEAGAELILREWKSGVAAYRTVFVTRADSGIEVLEDLKDKAIAFEDAGSTSAFLIPMATLRARGMEGVELARPGDWVPAGKFGYHFVKDEVNQLGWVVKEMAHAMAFSSLNWKDTLRSPETLTSRLRVFHETGPFLRSTVLVRGGLDSDVKRRLVEVMTTMHKDPQGASAMETFNKSERYDILEGEAAEDLAEARRLYAKVRDLL
jgi:phosphonate transport system substrate-binding protein